MDIFNIHKLFQEFLKRSEFKKNFKIVFSEITCINVLWEGPLHLISDMIVLILVKSKKIISLTRSRSYLTVKRMAPIMWTIFLLVDKNTKEVQKFYFREKNTRKAQGLKFFWGEGKEAVLHWLWNLREPS